jgi:truncated hemoglobin YjbI
MNNSASLYDRLGGQTTLERIVKSFYANMQDDFRLNRFFNTSEQPEQVETLTALIAALLKGLPPGSEEMTALLDDFFMAAFARNKRKSFVGGADFGFFGYIIEQDHPSTNYLCDGHSHLLKFMPESFHYDAVLENLAAALRSCNLDSALQQEILAWAEKGRNPVLGK